MNFSELEEICKSKAPVSTAWVQTNHEAIVLALEDFKTWGNDPTEEQEILGDMAWKLFHTWSYDMINHVMPHLSTKNQTDQLVMMIESVGREYEPYMDLSVCAPFVQRWIGELPLREQIEVLIAVLTQPYTTPECLSTAVGLCQITANAIDWGLYEKERATDNKLYWALSSELTLIPERQPNCTKLFEAVQHAHPPAFLCALRYVVAMQTQGGYCPSSDRIDLFNESLLPFLNPNLYPDLVQTYTTINAQLQRSSQPTLELPPRLLNFMLHQELNQSQTSSVVRGKKM